jgi:protoporphyrinogen oxidase
MLKKTEYASSISVAFKVPKDFLGQDSVIWVPFVESDKISGYTNEAMKGQDLIHNNQTLLCVWLHENYAKTLLNKPDEEIFNEVKKHFLEVCPTAGNGSQLQNYDHQKWPEAMPKFSHGHLKRVKEFLEQHQGEQKVFLCGDYLNSPWTEGSVQCGQRVAAEMVKQLR